jgi:predicted RNA-binding protein
MPTERTERDEFEQELRIKQMITNIEQMETNISKLRQDIRRDNLRIMISTAAALGAAFAGGAAAFGLLLHALGKL